ncbi:lysylphosphatidylglycerol synthase transmembrane domain-containing protein [Rubrobacter calidifluminis]|uniref:lysylphosphatidylglycerol synthase transmembrane domain-containing protein n=1 Tax=Rubrobacter calidifluminis TaxID=1392640 RepID=UPI0023607C9A|nr:flippase-like domain-containing protein [Rubrobacter calidifluminis]
MSRWKVLAGVALLAVAIPAGAVLVVQARGDVSGVLVRARPWPVGAALLLTAASYLFLSGSFAVLGRVFGVSLARRELFTVGFVSCALGYLTSAGGAAGYSLRVLVARRRGRPAENMLAASMAHSVMNNLILVLLVPAGGILLLGSARLSAGWGADGRGVVLFAGILAALAALVSVRRVRLPLWRALQGTFAGGFLGRLWGEIRGGVALLRSRPRNALVPLALSVADWGCSAGALWFCFDALGYHLAPAVLLAGFVLGAVAGAASMVPGGLGVQEASMSALFALLGVPLGKAVLAALLFRIVYYVLPFMVSLPLYRGLLRREAVTRVPGVGYIIPAGEESCPKEEVSDP